MLSYQCYEGGICMSEKDMVLSLQESEDIETAAFPTIITVTVTTSVIGWSTVSNSCDNK